MPASRRDELRFRGEYDGVSARRVAEHGGDARDGTRPADARRGRYLPPGRLMVPGYRRRLYLDGAVVPAVVRGHREGACEIPHLQRLEPPSTGKGGCMK